MDSTTTHTPYFTSSPRSLADGEQRLFDVIESFARESRVYVIHEK